LCINLSYHILMLKDVKKDALIFQFPQMNDIAIR